jgi:tetratricopeptide (TPR) repeat protein
MKKRDRATADRRPEKLRAPTATSPKGEPSGTEPRSATPRPWLWHAGRCAVLLLMVGIVYRNSFQSGFVLDNKFIVQQDPRNKEASWENLKLIWTKDYWWPRSDTGGYRPLVTTSYLLNWSVFGNGQHQKEAEQVIGFHWLNMLSHGINAILVYLLMLKLLHGRWAAFFAAALFAVHPIATESVTNIIGRADEFAATGFLGATLLYICSTEARGFRKMAWLLAMTVVFAASIFSKESAATFLAVPLVFDAIYRWGSESYRGRRAKGILSDCLGYLVLLPPFFALLYVRHLIFRDAPAPPMIFVDNPILRFAWSDANSLTVNLQNWILGRITACHVALIALWKLIWPVSLSSDYSWAQIDLFSWQLSRLENAKAVLSVLFIAGTLALAAWCYRRHKAVSFLILVYWIAYAPASHFTVIGPTTLAERLLYLPLVAFCGLLVLGMEAVSRRIGTSLDLAPEIIKRPWPRLVPHAVLLLILVLCGFRTYNRNFDWRSDMTLAQSAVKVVPRSFRGYQMLAFGYYETDPVGKIDRILELGETGVRILEPLSPQENTSRMYLHMGIYYGMKGEMSAGRNPDGSLIANDTTRAWYRKSAQVLERGTEIDLAANETNRANELKRGHVNVPDVGVAGIYMYLGIAYSGLGMNEKALQAFQYMRHLDPREPMSYIQAASTQIATGNVDGAAVSLLQCLIANPQHAQAWQSLIDIYSQINREPIPAIELTNGQPKLREDNQMVQKHLLEAYRGSLQTAQSARRPLMLNEVRNAAVNTHHLDPKLLDNALDENGALPVPPAPVFHTYGKKLSEEPLTQAAR